MPHLSVQAFGLFLSRRAIYRFGLLILAGCLAYVCLVAPIALRPASFPLDIGDVSAQDIRAPRAITFESRVLTEQARQAAARAVDPVYLPVDPGIARHQIERMRVSFAFITTTRSDIHASQDEKLGDLRQLADIHLSSDTAAQLLRLSDVRWQAIQQEALSVLEQIMRQVIRDDGLENARRSTPTLISLSLPQDQAVIVSELVTGFIIPNSLFDADQTEAARLKMSEGVTPINRSFMAGETIVQTGQIITPTIHEVLDLFGLVQPKNHNLDLVAAGMLVLLVCTFLGLYFNRRRPAVLEDMRSLLMISGVFLVFLVGARFVIPNRTIIPYLYPLPAFGLTIAALYNMELGLVLSLVLSVLSAYGLPNTLDLTLFYTLSSLCGVLALGRAHRIGNFFWAGIMIGAAGSTAIVAYRLSDSITDWIGLATLIGSAFLNGLASASLALIIQFLFSQVLGLTTALQLLELSRPDHPLLQFILRNAPGTYQHSLQVANLAEQAAEDIGADGLLTRVGALYHDAGKAMNPLYFIENQVPGNLNPHDELDPINSAKTIIQHVESGLSLARKFHLPPRIRDFVAEHHGTMITKYQYHRAMENAQEHPELINREGFRYPGPRPRSRETALIMLADNCEARARAQLPKDDDELMDVLRSVFERCQQEGQLDDTQLTLKDLRIVMESFASTLKGIHHPRILYPETNPSLPNPRGTPAELPEGDRPPTPTLAPPVEPQQ
ncbi:MAG: HDIG domain-containing protein [Anaerolineaceae bacterium]|nr:HDIG domain-containing protein [Anaerolineaceae bacterium]